MKISLSKINKDKESFHFTEENQEFSERLSDILGKAKFEIQLEVTELGEAIEAKGHFKAKPLLECSFCAEDYPYSLSFDFQEYLFPEEAKRAAKLSGEEEVHIKKVDLENKNGNDVSVVGDEFLFLDYIYDKVGFHIPFQVPCKDKKEYCENYTSIQSKIEAYKAPEEVSENPFAALKSLKVDKKH